MDIRCINYIWYQIWIKKHYTQKKNLQKNVTKNIAVIFAGKLLSFFYPC